MTIYLDNNVLVDVEEGTIPFESLISAKNVAYCFSEVHIDELMNGLDKHPELKDIRLNTLSKLCGMNYIAPDVGPFKGGFKEETPQKVLELSMQFKAIHDQLYSFSNAMSVNREAFLSDLHLEKLVIGNYKPSEIFNVLDDRLTERWGYGIKVYLEKSLATTGRTVFSSLFNLLDFVSYWHDKNHSARLYDSSHAYFGQYCDVLVSNDKRMRIKTEAVYSYLSIPTRVYSNDEFLAVLKGDCFHTVG